MGVGTPRHAHRPDRRAAALRTDTSANLRSRALGVDDPPESQSWTPRWSELRRTRARAGSTSGAPAAPQGTLGGPCHADAWKRARPALASPVTGRSRPHAECSRALAAIALAPVANQADEAIVGAADQRSNALQSAGGDDCEARIRWVEQAQNFAELARIAVDRQPP
jgi:hypothetical protein